MAVVWDLDSSRGPMLQAQSQSVVRECRAKDAVQMCDSGS